MCGSGEWIDNTRMLRSKGCMIEWVVRGRRWYNVGLDTIWVVGRRHGSFMAMNLINKFIDR
jgi:hypothetical protein